MSEAPSPVGNSRRGSLQDGEITEQVILMLRRRRRERKAEKEAENLGNTVKDPPFNEYFRERRKVLRPAETMGRWNSAIKGTKGTLLMNKT